MPFAAEELTRRFHEWERRGRGWLQWPRPVALEPPFRPFYGHFILSPATPKDDGRRETVVSRFLGSLVPKSVPTPAPQLPEGLFEEPDPEYVERQDYAELAIALPEGTRIDHDAAEGLLVALGASRHPIAFEIIGTSERITMQLAAAEDEAPHVAEALRGFFPTAGVAEGRGLLLQAWREAGQQIALVECALAREFMLPLRTFLKPDPDPLIGLFAALG